MAIDLSQVEPLGSKSVLMEQAMRRQRDKNKMGATANYYADMHEDMIQPDFEWLKNDQAAIKNLVSQMDGSVGQLAQQLSEVQTKSERSRQYIEKEQQLLFKQIHTLNGLLKKQVDVFSVMERKVAHMDIQNSRPWQSIAIGVVAGLASAITILAASPFAVMLLQKISAA